jgi:chemotaxis protein methyltransferase CheR
MSMDAAREFVFSAADFRRVQNLIKTRAGIDLGENKQSLVYGRLARRLRALHMQGFGEYLSLVEDASSDEAGRFVNAITTNVTEFFRENHHFEYLAKTVLPALWRQTGTRRVRFWSAGCSTGEEPYSLAMTLRENMPPSGGGGWDIKILATDLDTDVLAHASEGHYAADRIDKISPQRLHKFFRRSGSNGAYQASPELRSLITFKQLNLMEPWPMQGPFDVIFCRNVVIYFDDATKRGLIQRYRQLLGDAGYLMLGHSESLVGSTVGFEGCGRTIYRKAAGARPVSS